MNHSIIFKDKDYYASFPILDYKDGTLTVAFFAAPFVDHCGIYAGAVRQSNDNGKTWFHKRIKTTPLVWPSSSPREQSDRYTGTLPDGTPIMTGSTGWTLFPKKEKKWFKKHKFVVFDHQGDKKTIVVGDQKLFLSTKQGRTWKRKEWVVPDVAYITTFPRALEIMSTNLNDGSSQIILLPAYAILRDGRSQNLIWRSDNHGEDWELINMFPYNVAYGNEMAFIEVGNKILALIRSDRVANMMESWSSDYGRTWSYPLYTDIVGGPPHLLNVNDKLLCTYGYRQNKKIGSTLATMIPDFSLSMGIRARVSEDGRNWGKEIILRDDGGTPSRLHKKRQRSGASDVGYPVSVQLSDGSIFTVYYITLANDGVTHIAATKWRI